MKLAVALVLLTTPAMAGGIEIDRVTRHPSTAEHNVYDRVIRSTDGKVDLTRQWEEHNSNTAVILHDAAVAKSAEAADRASRAYEKEATAAAKSDNARGNLLNNLSNKTR